MLLAVILIAFFAVKVAPKSGESSPEPTATPLAYAKSYPVTETLSGFPTDINKPRSATLTAQEEVFLNNSVQLTQFMTSPKSVEENYDYYIDQFERKDWKIVSQSREEDDSRIIFAQGKTGIMNVVIEQNSSVSGQTDITLNFVLDK